ncbi:MAG: L,D-transpeptidase family protein [Bacteroidales bacterium]|nr:L,D-transpeptidase family protein [Bacteroidales bacterium]
MKKRTILKISSLVLLIFLSSFLNYFYPKKLDADIKITKIIVLKSKRELQIFHNNDLVKTYKISLGRQPIGAKHFQGDNKTPEGNYFINDKNPNSGYHLNLGISYPAKKDISYAKRFGKSPGGAIKIHGLKNGFGFIGKLHRLLDWTHGCIAMTNHEIEELYKSVKIGTPIEIRP